MADFYTDIHSIQHLVHMSRTEDEAKNKFYNLNGISLNKDQAELAYKDAVKKRFPQKTKPEKTQAFLSLVLEKYQIKD